MTLRTEIIQQLEQELKLAGILDNRGIVLVLLSLLNFCQFIRYIELVVQTVCLFPRLIYNIILFYTSFNDFRLFCLQRLRFLGAYR